MHGTEKKRILLVEDDATISDLLAYNLRRAGYEVLQEHNGRTGLETALTASVDLVLMDLMLPGLDGISAQQGDLAAQAGSPHHHADRAQRARDHARGLRVGGGRLHHQAVRPRCAARPHPGHACGARRPEPPRARRADERPSTSATCALDPDDPHGADAPRARPPSIRRSTTCWSCSSPARATCSLARRSWRGSGISGTSPLPGPRRARSPSAGQTGANWRPRSSISDRSRRRLSGRTSLKRWPAAAPLETALGLRAGHAWCSPASSLLSPR